jgi:ABC-type multidrug transport system fused ATPase/permease subunit
VLASVGFNIADAVEVVIEAIATSVILALVDPRLLAIPLFAVPSVWAGARAERLRQQALDDTADDDARARHLFELATSPGPGKELRIYGLGSELVNRHRAAERTANRALDRAARQGLLSLAVGWLLFTVGYAVAIVLVVRSAIAGTATVGEVVLALTLIARINTQVGGAVGTLSVLARTASVAGRYQWLEDYASACGERSDRRRGTPAVPSGLTRGIELRDVTFRYPETERCALDSVNLFLPAGSTVAVVGENGAGKSTLVKLLCRLYEPVSGHILVDGVDLAHFDVDEWRARVSAGFQDFVRFELLMGEAVGVGDLALIEDVDAVRRALDRAQAGDVPGRLADGLDTPLGASFEGGTELSGGQWQKLALARTLMRRDPLLLILDEPSASLDADAEYALFSRYASEARGLVADRNAIVLLVSHRFSTVQMADTIVVLDDGRIVETGAHADLLAARGLYAELYELQARSYR